VVLHEFYFPLSFLELDGEPLPPSLQPLHAPGLKLIQTKHRSTMIITCVTAKHRLNIRS
jgi:hypothetical protein